MSSLIVARKQHCGLHAAISIVLVPALISIPSMVRAGKLDDTKQAVRNGSSATHSHDSDRDESEDAFESEDSGGAILACLIPFVLPFCLIAAAVKDDGGHAADDKKVYFLPHPYAGDHLGRLVTKADLETGPMEPVSDPAAAPDKAPNGFENEGAMIISDTTDGESAVPDAVSRVGGKLSAEYYYDLDTVHVPGVNFLIDSSSRVGFETEWRLFLEPMDIGWDQLWMGMFNLNIRFIQSPMLEAGLGLGGRLMIVDGVDGGFNSTFSFDVFPVRPLLIAADIHVGNLGHALFLEGQLALGVTLGHAALFAGYRGTLIQGRSEGVVFHGPTAGVAAWF